MVLLHRHRVSWTKLQDSLLAQHPVLPQLVNRRVKLQVRVHCETIQDLLVLLSIEAAFTASALKVRFGLWPLAKVAALR